MVKKQKTLQKKRKKKYKAFFQDQDGIFIIEKLTCDIIESRKLLKATELRKKIEYNHNDNDL